MLLIPAIDLRGGRCVRLFQGDFAAETQYDDEPENLARRYGAFGASWLHVVDLDGARDGLMPNRAIVVRLAAQARIKVQAGGGVRSAGAIEDLLLNGVSRVIIGSVAAENPTHVDDWLAQYGPERICLAFDVRVDSQGIPRVWTRGWTESTAISIWDALAGFTPGRLKHVLCTDIERDGALTGPNINLYAEGRRRFPQIAWQASGGIRSAADLAALAKLRLAAAVSGKALIEARITPEELRPFLQDASSPASTYATAKS